MIPEISIKSFEYELPEKRIAKYPLAQRDASKLLMFQNGVISDHVFTDLPDCLPSGALLVFNNTKVVQARLLFEKTEGAKPIEIFCLEPVAGDIQHAMAAKNRIDFNCLVGNAKRWKTEFALVLKVDESILLSAEKVGKHGDNFQIRFSWQGDLTFAEILEKIGKMPLPPYLKRASEESDKTRYQTIYATQKGSVAAPTAGLHFTADVMQNLRKNGIKTAETTLHVGAGTFKPVQTELVQNHEMHAEEIHVSFDLVETLLQHKGAVFAVGTTATRTLESLYWLGVKLMQNPTEKTETFELGQWEAYTLPQHFSFASALAFLKNYMLSNKLAKLLTFTKLMIAPGYKFRVIDGLITNFHQPASTLMLLVAAAIGEDWKQVYEHALTNDYRFLSFGDSNLYFISHANKLEKTGE